ncbi:hypothetical protein [Wenyingzhuangia fucanilytica]|nr:hypothetical protein [Wenyingzhuangia fucanilytica]
MIISDLNAYTKEILKTDERLKNVIAYKRPLTIEDYYHKYLAK